MDQVPQVDRIHIDAQAASWLYRNNVLAEIRTTVCDNKSGHLLSLKIHCVVSTPSCAISSQHGQLQHF